MSADLALANLHEAMSGLRYHALKMIGQLEREKELLHRDELLSHACYGAFSEMGPWRWWRVTKRCQKRGHDWQDVPEPVTIRRWCGRCYKTESM